MKIESCHAPGKPKYPVLAMAAVSSAAFTACQQQIAGAPPYEEPLTIHVAKEEPSTTINAPSRKQDGMNQEPMP